VEDEYGFKSLSLPREQVFEPYRSFRLRDVTIVDTVLIICFTWVPPVPGMDDHIYLPGTGRAVLLDAGISFVRPWEN